MSDERNRGAVSPVARLGHSLAHEGRTGCTILFGGFDDTETQLGDTWAWSGFGWERLDIDGPPAGGVYAITNDAVGVILHGGGQKAEGTAWCLEDRTWLHRDGRWAALDSAS